MRLTLLLTSLLALLMACSGGQERPTLNLEVVNAVREGVANRAESKTQRPAVTRAGLDTLKGSFSEAVLEREDQLAYLFVNARRRDSSGREIIVWRSEDNVSLTLRGDVLIATRGIGGDLISSDIRQGRGIGPAQGQGGRRMTFLSGDNHTAEMTFDCSVSDQGPRTITIVERAHRTRLLQERCSGPSGEILNQYWIDPAAGLAWQTRQWAGPDVGYIRLRRLTNEQK